MSISVRPDAVAFQNDHKLADDFRDWIQSPDFPCVGAKSALGKSQMDFIVARRLDSAWDDLRIHPHILETVRRYKADRALFRTFIVLFEGPDDLDEETFEKNLWARAQSLSDKDSWLGQAPDPSVSADPDDPHFSLSFGGMGFFLVGLHPNASRPARRFRKPALVFNLHDQFEALREAGRYETLRSAILARDVKLSGAPNPMLARHGEASEARQYSGRAVSGSWVCPFKERSAS